MSGENLQLTDDGITGADDEAPARTVSAPRSRRSLLAGMAAAAGALVAQAATAPLPGAAANGSTVRLGQTNTGTAPTRVRNTRRRPNARGLVGQTTWTGSAPQSAGVEGESKGADGIGVFGKAHKGSGARAVLGISNSGTGVKGQGSEHGVHGAAMGPTRFGQAGVRADGGHFGVDAVGAHTGVRGNGPVVGVFGAATSSGTSAGVVGFAFDSVGYAGLFAGRVSVSGFLEKPGGGFKIDHPLEPRRRYLVHSFVESPEMLNVYSGRVTLNSRGKATVRLPRYFEAANRAPRYQLTPIGNPAPELHVAKEVENNRFVIAGGPPGLVVSWQVTAARDDAWARKNPLRIEPLKSKADRGKLLQPEAFGERRSSGIMALRLRPPRRPRQTS